MSVLEDLLRGLAGGGTVEIINLDDLLRNKEPWELAGEHLTVTTESAKRTCAIFRQVGRDDYAEAFHAWFKAHTKPIKNLIDEKPKEDYSTDEDRQRFIDEFVTRATALLPVADSMIGEIRQRHRDALRVVDCSDLFPVPAPTADSEPAT